MSSYAASRLGVGNGQIRYNVVFVLVLVGFSLKLEKRPIERFVRAFDCLVVGSVGGEEF